MYFYNRYMEYLENLNFINQLVQDITRPRNFPYSSFAAQKPQYANFIDLKVKDHHSGRDIKTFLYENPGPYCIVYLHGLSSCSMEGRYLAEHVRGQMSLCVFDFQGHGKSKGEIVTYGLNEKYNLYSVLKELVRRGYTDIVLWGRSMGAVTSLLFLKDPLSKRLIPFIKYLILDSPFSSFRKVLCQLACQKFPSLPEFLLQMLVTLLRNSVLTKHSLDLFEVDLTDCSSITIPALFIYSKEDEVVSWKHSEEIYSRYGGQKERMEVEGGHNGQRDGDGRIMGRVRKHCGIDIKRGISIYSSKDIASLQTVPSEKCLNATQKSEKCLKTVMSMPSFKKPPKQKKQDEVLYKQLSNIAYL